MHDCECFRVWFKDLHDIPAIDQCCTFLLPMTLAWSCPKEWTHWAKCVYNKSPFSHVYLWQINNGNCWCTIPFEALQTSCTGPFVSQHLSFSLNLHSCERVREHWSIEGLLSACTLWWRSEGECAQLYKNISQPFDLMSACHLQESLPRNFNSIKIVLSRLVQVTQTQNIVKFKCENLYINANLSAS